MMVKAEDEYDGGGGRGGGAGGRGARSPAVHHPWGSQVHIQDLGLPARGLPRKI